MIQLSEKIIPELPKFAISHDITKKILFKILSDNHLTYFIVRRTIWRT